MEWISVNDTTSMTADEKWIKIIDENNRNEEVIIKVSDKSLWTFNQQGDELIPLGQEGVEPMDSSQVLGGGGLSPPPPSPPPPPPPPLHDSCLSDDDVTLESADSSCAYADLAEISVELVEAQNGGTAEAQFNHSAYLIPPTLLPTEFIKFESALCFVSGFSVADGSNETAEYVAEHWSNTFLAMFRTFVHKRGNELWRVSEPPGLPDVARPEIRAWDSALESLKIRRTGASDLVEDEWSDQMSIIMLESTLKSVQQISTELIDINARRQVFGGCSALTFTAFGPCDDGSLRAVLCGLGNLRACLVRKNMELIPLIPDHIGDLSTDYELRPSKMHPDGLKVSDNVLRLKFGEKSEPLCHISRGYGHVQLFGRTVKKSSQFTPDVSSDPLRRQPYLVFMDINIEEDAMIVCTEARPNGLSVSDWREIVQSIVEGAAVEKRRAVERPGPEDGSSLKPILIIKLFATVQKP